MRNFYIEINGKAIKDYKTFTPAYKLFLAKSINKKNVVNLYELKSHALKGMPCSDDHYILIESNSNND